MGSAWADYGRFSRRRQRRAARAGQRLDIQGLRMVAVLTVFANHLWGWPSGGFIGVDVFFVISGFLITSNLLRTAETNGNVSFRQFYWNRVRRIVPAATVVLLLTCVAAYMVFLPFRAEQVGIDAIWAFVFLSNWWFGIQGTDYFTADNAVSPIQHYWSLSIEEQFYFVWPALIFIVGVFVVRRAWTHSHRLRIASAVMVTIVAASLGWAIWQSATSPTWAYFDTFARVWELGTGALLATTAVQLARIPQPVKPVLSWGGLGLIAASLFLIGAGTAGFPAPWALLPVIGAAMVITAGIGEEPEYQAFLRNPVSGYIGDISYSLYLTHWPIIVIAAALMDGGTSYTLVVIGLAFGLAILSYHFVENPLRRADRATFVSAARDLRRGRYYLKPSTNYAAAGALALIALASVAYIVRPDAYTVSTPPPLAVAAPDETDPSGADPDLGPLTTALRNEINAALGAEEWPTLDPTIEQAINGSPAPEEIQWCGLPQIPRQAKCTYGSPTAPISAVLVGDSIAMGYAGPLQHIAETSNGQLFVRNEAMYGCQFVDDTVTTADEDVAATCPGRKARAVDLINSTRPNLVIISDVYGDDKIDQDGRKLSYKDWGDSMRRLVDKFRGSGARVVFLAPPPPDKTISECFGKRSSTPADCVGEVTNEWRSMAEIEQSIAEEINGAWIDSRLWFCSANRHCPAFVTTVPTKMDWAHMTPAYGLKIAPVIDESFRRAGLY